MPRNIYRTLQVTDIVRFAVKTYFRKYPSRSPEKCLLPVVLTATDHFVTDTNRGKKITENFVDFLPRKENNGKFRSFPVVNKERSNKDG